MNKQKCLRCQTMINQQIKFSDIWRLKKIEEQAVCEECKKKFTRMAFKTQCQYCQHPIQSGNCCTDCCQWLALYGENYLLQEAIFCYDEWFKQWISDYKYRLDVRQAMVMKPILEEFYQKYSNYHWTILPSSPRNLAKRGFNPSEYLLKVCGIPYSQLFDYYGDRQSQAKKSRSERLSLPQVFQLREHDLNGEAILVFDDVYTTGATLIRAKECVIKKTSLSCRSLTLARDILE